MKQNNFKISDFITNIVLNIELQNCTDVYALDRASLADRSKNIDMRAQLKLGTPAICDYLFFNRQNKNLFLIEKKNLINKFNNSYTRDNKLIKTLVKKVFGTIGVIVYLSDNKIIKLPNNHSYKFIFIIEGSMKNSNVFQSLSNDIHSEVFNKTSVTSEIIYAEDFMKKYKKILK